MGLSPAPAPPWQMTSSGGSYGSMAPGNLQWRDGGRYGTVM